MTDWAELRELVYIGNSSEICEFIAGVAWEELPRAYAYAKFAGVTENDVMLWIYINLK